MAFRRSSVLQAMQKYQTSLDSPFSIEPSKMKYDPSRYQRQYTNNLVRQGYDNGTRFLSRYPDSRKVHPVVLDLMNAERFLLVLFGIGVVLFTNKARKLRNEEDKQFYHSIFQDKEFVDRYSYKTQAVEYARRVYPAFMT